MTEPREVTVSDEEVEAVIAPWKDVLTRNGSLDLWREKYRLALQVIIARRVPDAPTGEDERLGSHAGGFKACRDKVLKGV